MQDKTRQSEIKATFSETHPKINTLLGMFFLLILIASAVFSLFYIVKIIGGLLLALFDSLSEQASKFDAVIIVALITGTVSIIGVVLSSIVAKIIDYKKAREAYLAQKREKSYEHLYRWYIKC